jgi:hypothetical protein
MSRTRRRRAQRQAMLAEEENFACADYPFVSKFNQPAALFAFSGFATACLVAHASY